MWGPKRARTATVPLGHFWQRASLSRSHAARKHSAESAHKVAVGAGNCAGAPIPAKNSRLDCLLLLPWLWSGGMQQPWMHGGGKRIRLAAFLAATLHVHASATGMHSTTRHTDIQCAEPSHGAAGKDTKNRVVLAVLAAIDGVDASDQVLDVVLIPAAQHCMPGHAWRAAHVFVNCADHVFENCATLQGACVRMFPET